MFDIGFPELLIVSIVALLVLGPERLPEALRTLGLWFGRMRRSFSAVKVEIEREIGMDEVRRQLHNEAILEEMRALEADVGKAGNSLQNNLQDDANALADTFPGNGTQPSAEELDDEGWDGEIINEPHPDDRADQTEPTPSDAAAANRTETSAAHPDSAEAKR